MNNLQPQSNVLQTCLPPLAWGPLTFFEPDLTTALDVPYADFGVKAGFPSPAQEYVSERIDLNKALVHNPSSTFFARVDGISMVEEGIDDGDLIVVDRSLEPRDGDLAVCCLDGEFTLKRIRLQGRRVVLMPSNRQFRPIVVTEDNEFCVWGIVTHTIKSNRTTRE